uniref:Uncharacterized protein n=1 Tax=Globisporangium ultimum (strain ATCC 200006 / CBS 805.95 / DAOM BR144) TaxID=431595 RepID=K3X9E7_GLOUD
MLTPPAHIALVPWDDGFTPSGCNNKPGKIVRDQVRSTPRAFQVVDHAVERETAQSLYESAVRARVWGVYVPTRELRFTSDAGLPAPMEQQKAEDAGEEQYRKSIAKRAVQELLVDKAASMISREDWERTHGVAVWVIASDCDDETEYHLDYAEMVRYETNVIVPPIYGATLHVSPLQCTEVPRDLGEQQQQNENEDEDQLDLVEGGGFHVNLDGLEHYKQYGYKTRLRSKLTTDALEAISLTEPGWQHVPYLYRRGIICDGEFPHFSGRVRALPKRLNATTATSAMLSQLPVKRVVVGFNLFPHEIGAFVQKFPEHSAAFNKYIKLSQAAVKKTTACADDSGTKWSLASLRANPKQAAFVKLLARKLKEKNVDLASLRQQQREDAAAAKEKAMTSV